jgi:hypothetical protein
VILAHFRFGAQFGVQAEKFLVVIAARARIAEEDFQMAAVFPSFFQLDLRE